MSFAHTPLWFSPPQRSLIRFVSQTVFVRERVLEMECRLIAQDEDDPDLAVREYLTSLLLRAYLPSSSRR